MATFYVAVPFLGIFFNGNGVNVIKMCALTMFFAISTLKIIIFAKSF